jgi:metal-dependent amidase/aminoacylase/carboxypeptidase family protein
MHPVTRLGRVIQQLTSFGELHAGELETLAAELEATSADVAARLRVYRDVQRDEAQMIVDELVDLQADMAATDQAELAPTEAATVPAGSDPAINSPRRARWLAEQAEEEERRRQPLSRRDFFSGGAKPDE